MFARAHRFHDREKLPSKCFAGPSCTLCRALQRQTARRGSTSEPAEAERTDQSRVGQLTDAAGKKGKTLVFATKEAPGIDMAIQSATMAMAAWRAMQEDDDKQPVEEKAAEPQEAEPADDAAPEDEAEDDSPMCRPTAMNPNQMQQCGGNNPFGAA